MNNPIMDIGDKSLKDHPFFVALRAYIANKIVRNQYERDVKELENKWNEAKESTNDSFKLLLEETDQEFPGSEYDEDVIDRVFRLHGKSYHFKYDPMREFSHDKIKITILEMFEKPTP